MKTSPFTATQLLPPTRWITPAAITLLIPAALLVAYLVGSLPFTGARVIESRSPVWRPVAVRKLAAVAGPERRQTCPGRWPVFSAWSAVFTIDFAEAFTVRSDVPGLSDVRLP